MRRLISSPHTSWIIWVFCMLGLSLFFPMLAQAQGGVALTSSSESAFFTPSSNDQSIIYLGELFGNIPPVLAGTGSSLMGDLFKIFNTVVMSLGIIFAGYTTFVGILNTAGEGEMLGKGWSSIWVPIRTVAGIALLIPTTSGYCVIQVFMMWLLIQGIGAADTLTGGIIDYMKSGQKVFIPGNTPNSSGGTSLIKTWDSAIMNVYEGLSCMQGLQKNYPLVNPNYVTPPKAVDAPYDASNPSKQYNPASSNDPTIYYNFIAYKYTSTTPNPDGTYDATPVSCGTLKYDNTSSDQKKMNPYLQQGLEAIMPSLNAAAYYMVNDPSTNETTVMEDTFNFVGSDFMNQVATAYNAYVTQAHNATDSSYKNSEYLEDIRSYGWISIGNLYWDMAKMSGSNNLSSMIDFNEDNGDGQAAKTAKLSWDASEMNIGDANAKNNYGSLQVDPNESVYTYGNTYGSQFIKDLQASRDADNNGSGKFYSAAKVDYSTATNGIMSSMTLAVLNRMQKDLSNPTKSPMIAAQSLGHHILYDVEALMTTFVALAIVLTAAITASAAGVATIPFMAAGIGPLAVWLGIAFVIFITAPFLFVLYGVLMTLGSVLAVIIPMIPALVFFLAAIAWMVATLETIVAAPIVAMGVIHPEGHQVWGKAEPAMMLMTNMFLRPSLMVIGMAAGVILSFISVQFVNFGYSQVLASIYGGVGADNNGANGQVMVWNISSGITWVESTMFLSTYVALILACVNKSFSVIDAIPDTVMRWIQGGEGSKFGGGQEAMQKLQGSQESAGQKASGDTISSGQEGSQAGDKALDKGEKAMAITSKESKERLSSLGKS